MRNTIGSALSVTLFGESHGEAIGAVIDGIAAGVKIDEEFISLQLSRRRPQGSISTPLQEKDEYKIISGVFEGRTTGAPICIIIPNGDTHSTDYGDIKNKMRPSHADYTAFVKYGGFADYRGGGHFSGRITAAIVAAAAIVIPALNKKGIKLGTHIKSIAGVCDRAFESENDIELIKNSAFPLLDESVKTQMTEKIEAARSEGNSVGGKLETAIYGMPAGIGEPWFDTLEGTLSHALFSIPALKGVEFGLGFGFAQSNGKDANDQMFFENGTVKTYTNNNGGITGGISNGMPIVFTTVIKPTPTISAEQKTVDVSTMQNTTLCAHGRHDPCIVHRAAVVQESVTALVLADMLCVKYGTDWLGE